MGYKSILKGKESIQYTLNYYKKQFKIGEKNQEYKIRYKIVM